MGSPVTCCSLVTPHGESGCFWQRKVLVATVNFDVSGSLGDDFSVTCCCDPLLSIFCEQILVPHGQFSGGFHILGLASLCHLPADG